MDGSARRFVSAILRTGLAPVAGPLARDPHPEAGALRAGRRRRRAQAGGDAVDRLRDRLRRRGDRPSASASHGQRRLRPRARRLPHLLPPAGRRGDAGQRPRARRLARQRGRRRGRPGAEPGRLPPARTSSSATRCSTRSATSRSRARRSSAPTGASVPATGRPTSCCGSCSRTPEAFEIRHARRRGSGPAARRGRRRGGPAPRRLRQAVPARAQPRRSPAGCAFRFNPPETCANPVAPGSRNGQGGQRGVREGQGVGLLASRGRALAAVLVLALVPGACSRMPAWVPFSGPREVPLENRSPQEIYLGAEQS